MKKMSLIALALLVGLPGCGNKQKKAKENNRVNIEKHVDMFSSIEENDVFAADDLDEDYDSLRTLILMKRHKNLFQAKIMTFIEILTLKMTCLMRKNILGLMLKQTMS